MEQKYRTTYQALANTTTRVAFMYTMQ